MTTTNDPHHDRVRDIHFTHPTDCPVCEVGPSRFACLSHTCPDCGAIVHALKNSAGELIHDCCTYCVKYARPGEFAPRHFASTRCQSGRHAHCTCDTCF